MDYCSPSETECLGYEPNIGIVHAEILGNTISSFLASTASPAEESMVGFLARISALNAFKHLPDALRKVDLHVPRPSAIAVAHLPAVQQLAFLLKVPQAELRQKFYPSLTCGGGPGRVLFFGVAIRPIHRESRVRRVAPGMLRTSPYHRAVWELRPLSFDPDTLERLISQCPVCGRSLGWSRTLGIVHCEKCTNGWGRPVVDLRDVTPERVVVEDEYALMIAGALTHPDPAKRSDARRALAPVFSEVTEGDVVELVVTLADLLSAPAEAAIAPKRRRRNHPLAPTADRLATAARMLIDWPKPFHDLAARFRAAAVERSGSYGARKELGPLVPLARDNLFSPAMRAILRSAVDENLAIAAKRGLLVRRQGNRHRDDLLTAQEVEQRFGIPRRVLPRLEGRKDVTTLRGGAAHSAPLLFVEEEIRRIAAEWDDLESAASASARLGVPVGVMGVLCQRGHVVSASSAAIALTAWPEAYRRSSVDALCAALASRIRRDARRTPGAIGLELALRRVATATQPWPNAIEAILDGRLTTYWSSHKGSPVLKRLAVMTAKEVQDVLAPVEPPEQSTERGPDQPGVQVSQSTAGWLLGVSAAHVSGLMSAGLLMPESAANDRLTRADVELFHSAYALTPEIARRLGVAPCLVPRIMKEQGFAPYRRIDFRGRLVWHRSDVEEAMKKRLRA